MQMLKHAIMRRFRRYLELFLVASMWRLSDALFRQPVVWWNHRPASLRTSARSSIFLSRPLNISYAEHRGKPTNDSSDAVMKSALIFASTFVIATLTEGVLESDVLQAMYGGGAAR